MQRKRWGDMFFPTCAIVGFVGQRELSNAPNTCSWYGRKVKSLLLLHFGIEKPDKNSRENCRKKLPRLDYQMRTNGTRPEFWSFCCCMSEMNLKEIPHMRHTIFVQYCIYPYMGNMANLAVRHEFNESIHVRYCGILLYLLIISVDKLQTFT